MTQYIVQAPDGSKHIIEGPDQSQGSDQGALMAGGEHLLDMATFGLAKPVEAAVGAVVHGIPYSQARANLEANQAATTQAHPAASMVGDIAGFGASIPVGGEVVGGARAIPAIAKAANAVKAAPVYARIPATIAADMATGAAFGGVQGASENGVEGAKEGAEAGVVAVPLARPVAAALRSPAAAAYRVIAKSVKLPGETLDAAATRIAQTVSDFKNAFGRNPSMSEAIDASQSREIAQTIGRRAGASQYAAGQENAAAVNRQGELSTALAQGGPTNNINDLVTQRSARATAAMESIRQTPVLLTQDDVGLLMDKRTRAATNGDPVLQRKLDATINDLHPAPAKPFQPEPFTGNNMTDFNKWEADQTKARMAWEAKQAPVETTSSRLTLDDIDALRKSLRGRQSVYANPQSAVHNPHTAQSYGQLSDSVAALGSAQDQRYGDMLDQYERDSTYIRGFKHGMAGKDVGEAEKGELRDALTRSEGQQGYAAGTRSRLTGQASESPNAAVGVARDITENQALRANLGTALGPTEAAQVQRTGELAHNAAKGMASAVPRTGTQAEETADTSSQALRAGLLGVHGGSSSFMAHVVGHMVDKFKLPLGTAKKVAELAMDPKNTPAVLQYLRARGTTPVQRHEFMNLIRSGMVPAAGGAAGKIAQ